MAGLVGAVGTDWTVGAVASSDVAVLSDAPWISVTKTMTASTTANVTKANSSNRR